MKIIHVEKKAAELLSMANNFLSIINFLKRQEIVFTFFTQFYFSMIISVQ